MVKMRKEVSFLLALLVAIAFSLTFKCAVLLDRDVGRLNQIIALEIMRRLENITFEFVNLESEFSIVSHLKAGDIDLYVGLPRLNKMTLRYSNYPVYAVNHVIYRRKSFEGIVGVLKGTEEERLAVLLRNTQGIRIYESVKDLVKAFKKGEVDSIFLDSIRGEHVHEELMDYYSEYVFGKSYRFVAFSRAIPLELIRRIDRVLKSMYRDRSFEEILEYSGFESSVIPPNVLLFVNSEWPPYEFIENGKWMGIDVEILREVLQQLGYEVRIKKCPWLRCLGMIKSRNADGTFSVERTAEREKFMFYTEEPTAVGKDVFFYLKNHRFDMENPMRYSCGYVAGYAYEDFLKEKGFKMIRVNDDRTGMTMLVKGRIDLFISDLMVGLYHARKLGVLQYIRWTEPVRINNLYVAFSKIDGHETLAKDFTNALRVFKRSERYLDILRSYGSTIWGAGR